MLSSNLKVNYLCKLFSVSESGYYKWLKRIDKLNSYESRRELIKGYIKEVHKKHKSYGYRHIARKIRRDKNIEVSDYLCYECCKELGIKSKSSKVPFRKPGTNGIKYSNKINNDW